MTIPKLIKQFLVRFIVALLIIGGLTIRLYWWPAHQMRRVASQQAQQVEQVRQLLVSSRKTIAKINDPSVIERGKPPTGKQYAEDIAKIATELQKVNIDPPPSVNYSPALGSTARLISNINSLIADQKSIAAYKNANDASLALHSLLNYHSNVMKATANILDYDPAIDFKRFDLASKDTQTRLQKAKDGLDKVLKSLNATVDPKIDVTGQDLINDVKFLQAERDQLASTGNLAGWQQAVKNTQDKIQGNRSAFWRGEKSSLTKQLFILDGVLTDMVQKWINVTGQKS